MYISRVEIDQDDRKKLKQVSHVAAIHSWVENSFPKDGHDGSQSRKLWRIDKIAHKNYLLVVSSDEPNIEEFEKFGIPGTGEIKKYDSFLNEIHTGDQLLFRLMANPIVSISSEGKKRGRVKPHITVEHQKKFLLERSVKNGFELKEEDFTVIERGIVDYFKKGQKPVRLVQATYEGRLTVTDEEIFRKVLCTGIGKKKAYGFGLMTVMHLGANHG